MPPNAPMSGSPGWHPDPSGRYEFRYFNGTTWTGDVSTGGTRFIDLYHPASEPSATPRGRNGLAIAAMVCGIVACVIGWLPFVAFGGIVLAVLALCFGVIALRRARLGGRGRGMAIAGIATGAGGVALSVVGIVLSVLFLRWYDDYQNPEPADASITSCAATGDRVVAEGTITNVGDERQSYTVLVRLAADTFLGGRRERVDVPGLDPGESAEFTAFVVVERGATPEAPTCDVLRIDGPLPMGVDPEADG